MILKRNPKQRICMASLFRKMGKKSLSGTDIRLELPNKYKVLRVRDVTDTGIFLEIMDIENRASKFTHHFEFGKWITESMEVTGDNRLNIVASFTTVRF